MQGLFGLRNDGSKVAIRESHGNARDSRHLRPENRFALTFAAKPLFLSQAPQRGRHPRLMLSSIAAFVRRSPPASNRYGHTQHGAMALALMIMLGLAIGLLVISYARNTVGNDAINPRTIHALAQAREALLGYSTTYRDTHPGEVFGYFPCPDLGSGTEGQAATACGGTDITVIGRLPWKTLDLPPLRDASGECLWYAISGNYKNNPKTSDLLNRDTNGLIEVRAADGTGFIAGAIPTQRAVAVIFAAGAILPGQDRSLAATNPPTVCGGNYDPANYLDSDAASSIDNAKASTVANALTQFIAAQHSDLTAVNNDAFNDQLMTILPQGIWQRHLERRSDFETDLTDPLTGLLRRSADCLLDYGRSNNGGPERKYLPWAAPLAIPTFGDPLYYADTTGELSGRLPHSAFVTADSPYGTHNNDNYKTPDLLLDSTQCPGWDQSDEFWAQWKDHLFYAIARGHEVPYHDGHSDDPCADNECIDVENPAPDGNETNVAAVVIFAGERQTGQSRDNDANPAYGSTEKSDPDNYLEGVNVTSIQTNPTSKTDPNRKFSKIAGNDSIMCIVTRPVGSNSELFLDPTCGTSPRCVADGDALAAYRSGTSNNCRVGTSGIDPTCESLAQRIAINNCPGDPTFPSASDPVSCKRAAGTFLSFECLQGFATAKCQVAHTALTNCQ